MIFKKKGNKLLEDVKEMQVSSYLIKESIVKLNKVWIGYSVFINVSLYLKIIADIKALYFINIKDKKKTSINTMDQDNKRDEFYQNREFKTF